MKHKEAEKQSSADESESHADAAEWQKEAEAAKTYYRQKYNLPESLISLIGCISPLTDAERKGKRGVLDGEIRNMMKCKRPKLTYCPIK